MLIGETWLKPNIKFKIANYTIYRTDRTTQPHGGTAVLIKKHIPHMYHQTRQCQVENTTIQVNTQEGPLTLISAYCTPNNDISRDDLEKLFAIDEKTMLLGDLNAKNKHWGCNATNRSGKNLLDYFEQKDNIQLHIPNQPTHYHHHGRPEILDIGISQNIKADIEIKVLQDLSSDHNPIEIGIPVHKTLPEVVIKKITQWPKFTAWLKNNTSRIQIIHTKEDVDRELQTLTEEVQSAIQYCTKEITLQKQKTLLPVEILQLVKEKRQARKKAQRTLDPLDARIATRLNNQLKEALKEYHQDRWNYKL